MIEEIKHKYYDCHVHIFMNGHDFRAACNRHKNGVDESVIHEHFKQYQKNRITWIRDGGDAFGVSSLARRIAPEYGITYRTPLFAIHKNGHYGSIVGHGFDTLKEYAALVKKVREEGGHFIKIMTTGILDFSHYGTVTEEPLAAELVKEMVHIAHEDGFAVMAHTNGADAVKIAVEAKVDSIEHGNYQDLSSLRMLADSDTVWVPTLVTIRNLSGKGRFQEEELKKIQEMQTTTVRMAYEEGVKMAIGTDSGAWMVEHGSSAKHEKSLFIDILGNPPGTEQRLQKGFCHILRKFG